MSKKKSKKENLPCEREFFSTSELADRWGMSDATLRQWKYLEKYIKPCKIGGRLKYRVADVTEFEKKALLDFKKSKIKFNKIKFKKRDGNPKNDKTNR